MSHPYRPLFNEMNAHYELDWDEVQEAVINWLRDIKQVRVEDNSPLLFMNSDWKPIQLNNYKPVVKVNDL